jgi:HD-like signal output (HDOD) protein/CheY-like chemotaxis protein
LTRVLFVAPDTTIVADLLQVLPAYGETWEIELAERPDDALAILATAPFDVVVCDVDAPGPDRNPFLRAVRERHPDAARIVLSTPTDEGDFVKVVTTAHQFLAKPFDPHLLVEAVHRAQRLRDELQEAGIRAEIGGIETLPSPPATLRDVLAVVESPESTADDIAATLAQDVALTAKLLQLANSAFFARATKATRVRDAVIRLGSETVRSMILTRAVLRVIDHPELLPPRWGERFNAFTAATADLAGRLARPAAVADAYCAGVLVECGQLVLAACRPDVFRYHLRERERSGLSLSSIESATFGVTHGKAGAYLLSLWGFPWPVVEAAGQHDREVRTGTRFPFDCLNAVRVARSVVERDRGSMCGPARGTLATDAELDARGALAVVEQWRLGPD